MSLEPKKPRRLDAYTDLELSPAASSSEIKAAFRRLALQYHPDKNEPGETVDAVDFRRIQEAWDVLRDPEMKAIYDRTYSSTRAEWETYRAELAGYSRNPAEWTRKKHAENTRAQAEADLRAAEEQRRARPQYHPYDFDSDEDQFYDDDWTSYGSNYGENMSTPKRDPVEVAFENWFINRMREQLERERKSEEEQRMEHERRVREAAERKEHLRGAANERCIERLKQAAKAQQAKSDDIATVNLDQKRSMARKWVQGLQREYVKELESIGLKQGEDDVVDIGWDRQKGRQTCGFCNTSIQAHSYRCPSGGAVACQVCKKEIEASTPTHPFSYTGPSGGTKGKGKGKGKIKKAKKPKTSQTNFEQRSGCDESVSEAEDEANGEDEAETREEAEEKTAEYAARKQEANERKKARKAEQEGKRNLAQEAAEEDAETQHAAQERAAAAQAAREAAEKMKEAKEQEAREKKAARKKAAKEKVALEKAAQKQSVDPKEAALQALRDEEARERREPEKAQRAAKKAADREAKEKAEVREAEERAVREAEERVRREDEERAAREAAEQVARKAEEKAAREAEERAIQEAKDQAEREAKELAGRQAIAKAKQEAREVATLAKQQAHGGRMQQIREAKARKEQKILEKKEHKAIEKQQKTVEREQKAEEKKMNQPDAQDVKQTTPPAMTSETPIPVPDIDATKNGEKSKKSKKKALLPRTCHVCNQEGHIARFCPEKHDKLDDTTTPAEPAPVIEATTRPLLPEPVAAKIVVRIPAPPPPKQPPTETQHAVKANHTADVKPTEPAPRQAPKALQPVNRVKASKPSSKKAPLMCYTWNGEGHMTKTCSARIKEAGLATGN